MWRFSAHIGKKRIIWSNSKDERSENTNFIITFY